MQYRMLGRTGYKVSQLGFGAMRLPMKGDKVDRDLAIPMIHRAFEAGVNYIDTAVGYLNGDSQVAVGEALKGWREKIVVSTKNGYYGEDEKEWWTNLENSLKRLDVKYIDIYNTHGVSWGAYKDSVEPRISKWMKKAKDAGLIKHICTSFHDSNEALRKIVDTGFYDSVTFQYNLLDRQLEDAIAYAHEKGMGTVVMGPVGGGRLGADTDQLKGMLPEGVKRVPELALKFVLSNPNISVALSGMSTMTQVEENLKTAAEAVTLSPNEIKAIAEHLARLEKMSDLYCTGCGYCKPCTSNVDIPGMFRIYNEARAYGLWDHAKGNYSWMTSEKKSAEFCSECGSCLEKCPQKIAIPDRMKEIAKALGKAA
jgi:predicted aldo/keto reductase-like oxidoreductase